MLSITGDKIIPINGLNTFTLQHVSGNDINLFISNDNGTTWTPLQVVEGEDTWVIANTNAAQSFTYNGYDLLKVESATDWTGTEVTFNGGR